MSNLLEKLLSKLFVSTLILPGVMLVSCQSGSTLTQNESQQNKFEKIEETSISAQIKQRNVNENSVAQIDHSEKAKSPLDGQSLEELLLAEIAYQKRDYKSALALYYLLAKRTQDPQVAKQAAKIAAYLSEDEMLASMLDIWLGAYPHDQEALMLGLSNSLVMAQLDRFESRFIKIMMQKHDLNFLDLAQKLPVNIEAFDQLEALLVKLQKQYAQPQMVTVLAFVYEHQGKFEQSMRTAQKAIVEYDNPMVRLLLVNNYNVLGFSKQSDQMLEQSFEKFSSNKRLAEARIQLAWRNQEYSLAYQLTRQMYERNPNDPNLAYQFGRLALKQKDYEQANQVFNSLLVYPSLENEMNYLLGIIANDERDFELALRFFSKVKASSFYKNSQYFRVNIIWQATKDKQAITDVFDQLTLRAQEEDKLGIAILEAEFWSANLQYQTAIDRLEPIVSEYTEHQEVLFQYALLLDSAGYADQSLVLLKQLLETSPESASILNAYGYVLGNRTDQVALALTYVEQSLELDPGNAAALDSKGWLLYKLDKFEQALPLLQDAFEQFPHDEVAAHLGAVLWKLGKIKQAQMIWDQGFELQPNSLIIKEIKNSLEISINP